MVTTHIAPSGHIITAVSHYPYPKHDNTPPTGHDVDTTRRYPRLPRTDARRPAVVLRTLSTRGELVVLPHGRLPHAAPSTARGPTSYIERSARRDSHRRAHNSSTT